MFSAQDNLYMRPIKGTILRCASPTGKCHEAHTDAAGGRSAQGTCTGLLDPRDPILVLDSVQAIQPA